MTNQPMPLISKLDQHQLGFTDPSDTLISWTRRAVRAVMFSEYGKVAVMNFTKNGSYKLPGGGIDEGEDIENALRRELREEAGYTVKDIRELGVIEEDRYFCGMHQTSYCFIVTADTFVGTELTEKEADEGMNLVWLDTIDEVISAIESASSVDEDGSVTGLKMMIIRETAILRAATASLK